MNPKIRTAVRLAIGMAIAAATLSGPLARAEEAEPVLEEVTVTGSRIATGNMTSTSPILSVTSEEIKTGGRTSPTGIFFGGSG